MRMSLLKYWIIFVIPSIEICFDGDVVILSFVWVVMIIRFVKEETTLKLFFRKAYKFNDMAKDLNPIENL